MKSFNLFLWKQHDVFIHSFSSLLPRALNMLPHLNSAICCCAVIYAPNAELLLPDGCFVTTDNQGWRQVSAKFLSKHKQPRNGLFWTAAGHLASFSKQAFISFVCGVVTDTGGTVKWLLLLKAQYLVLFLKSSPSNQSKLFT